MSALCFGCGGELSPPKGPGRPKKWCSERCRKLTLYSRSCLDCGKPCNTDGRTTEAAYRCRDCGIRYAADLNAARGRSLAERELELRAAGLTNREIGARLGVPPTSVSRSMKRLRDAGVDVPVSPHYIAGRAA